MRILHSVPSRIGDSADPGESGDAAGPVVTDSEAAELVALMDNIAFTPDDVAGMVAGFCDQMDRWFDSDVWALTDGQQKLIGKPYAQLANTMWDRIKLKLPGWLTAACDSTPGLMGALMVTGVVFGPKTYQQWTVSRARAREQARPTIIASNDAPQSAPVEIPRTEAARPGGSRLRWPAGSGPRK